MPKKLRTYQLRVVDEIGTTNTIVKMPTGSGKTLIAAECFHRCLQRPENRGSKQGLFLVPTCDLVEQQAQAVREWCGTLRISEFMGGAATPSNYEVLVSTPEAFRQLQMRDDSFSWVTFAICVFDEVHHVLKDHPYRHLACGLRSSSTTQVLGLSASLTYAVSEAGIQKSLAALSQDLNLEQILSVSDHELTAGGYCPPHDEVEVMHPRVLPEGIVPEPDRRPHLMHQTFFARAKRNEGTDFAHKVHKVVQGLEKAAAGQIPNFQSPLGKASLSSWEDGAHKLAQQHHDKAGLLKHLETWYVALRMLVQTWEEEQELVLNWLRFSDAFAAKPLLVDDASMREFLALETMACNEENLSKLACLKGQLLEKKHRFSKLRGIVFVQQRITAHVLSHYINADPELRAQGIRAGYVAARGTKITPSIAMSKGAAAECIRKFRKGELNVLVATSVIEEGFDVPAANVVISFDHLKNSVELAQRFGRARQADRCIVVMDERHDRPIHRLEEVRREQDALIEEFQPAALARDAPAEKAAQRNRECGARIVLDNPTNSPVADLNLLIKKTKAHSEDHTRKAPGGNEWQCTIEYSTVLRSLSAEAFAASKSDARKACALQMLAELQQVVPK